MNRRHASELTQLYLQRGPLTSVEAAKQDDTVVHAAHRRVNSHSWCHSLHHRCVVVVETDPIGLFEVELARSNVLCNQD